MRGHISSQTPMSPTIADLRRDGLTGLRITCTNALCVWSASEPFDALGLHETDDISHVRERLRLTCSACGSDEFTLSPN
jgi:hypothetical protein